MKIAIVGGTGMIGSRIAAEAKQRGHSVTIVSRKSGTDARDPVALAQAFEGHDAIISAYSPSHDQPGELSVVAGALLHAANLSQVHRLLVVGGAGSLEVKPGLRLVDAPDFPPAWRGIALAHANALQVFKANQEIDWTYFSPAALIAPGERTGKFRLGGTKLVTDAKGESRISAEDFAIAVIDELEKKQHPREQITAAY